MVRVGVFLFASAAILHVACAHVDVYDEFHLLQVKHAVTALQKGGSARQPPFDNLETWLKKVNPKGTVDFAELKADVQRLCDPVGSCGAAVAMIENTLQPFLEEEGVRDSNAIDAAKEAHKMCITHRDARFEEMGDARVAWQRAQTARTKHQLCRKGQKSWQVMIDGKAALCSNDATLNLWDLPQSHETLALSISTLSADKAVYAQATPVGQNDCAIDQLRYEDAFCAARLDALSAAATAEACIAAAGVSEVSQQAWTRQADRSLLWDALQRIKCTFVDETPVDDSDYLPANCSIADPFVFGIAASPEIQGVTAIPTLPGQTISTWTNVPSLEDVVACQAWVQNEYDLGSDHWPVTMCLTTCSEPPLVAPVEVPNCHDVNTQCGFYRFHNTVCGNYDTDSFIAGEQCCACGGGQSGSSIETDMPSQTFADGSTFEYAGLDWVSTGSNNRWNAEEGWLEVEGGRHSTEKPVVTSARSDFTRPLTVELKMRVAQGVRGPGGRLGDCIFVQAFPPPTDPYPTTSYGYTAGIGWWETKYAVNAKSYNCPTENVPNVFEWVAVKMVLPLSGENEYYFDDFQVLGVPDRSPTLSSGTLRICGCGTGQYKDLVVTEG